MDKMIVRFKSAGSIGGSVNPSGAVGGKVKNPDKVYEKDYNNLDNRPQIEGHTLEDDMTFDDLGMAPLSAQELADMWGE